MGSKRINRKPKRGPHKTNAKTPKEVRPTASARKYKEMETRKNGTMGGGRKYKANKNVIKGQE